MNSNFFTLKEDIFDVASQLASQGFTELKQVVSYKESDTIMINGTKKEYWFTTDKLVESFKPYFKDSNDTLTKNITLNDIKKWQTK